MLNSKCQNAFLLANALALSEETLDPIYITMEKIDVLRRFGLPSTPIDRSQKRWMI